MSDLIERLMTWDRALQPVPPEKVMIEAADTIKQQKMEIERLRQLEKSYIALHAISVEQQAEIKRLGERENKAINALFDICKADWGIGHSLAKPAHKAIKELADG